MSTMASQPTPNSGECFFSTLQRLSRSYCTTKSAPLPLTTPERLATSPSTAKTILYLAYGSNLASSTFRGNRGIRPISAVNVHVPTLNLSFDLPGIPYTEPCFANTSLRAPPAPPTFPPSPPMPVPEPPYHKDRWAKGLIGVVYEVTPEDYRTIIATEGGGASYQDISVPCFVVPKGTKTVDWIPSGRPFLAHTLFSPPMPARARPDPSYAQPSERYLGLLTTGGEEHTLPAEYLTYLYQIRSYTITTRKQKIGRALFLGIWMPFILAFFALGKVLADKDGKVPKWFAGLTGVLFGAMWGVYDLVFKRAFGDGERSIDDGGDDGDGDDDEQKGEKKCWWDLEKEGCVRI